MGDENLNNSEDTSVLFVSGQRKKQAEDEAKRIAEQEQAEREAREAEIRRQEEEVASRQQKAEKVKKNLDIKEQESNANKKKNALKPVVIGVAAAVVIFLVIILWPQHKQVYMETAEFNAEYAITAPGYGLKIKYPDTVFSEVVENTSGDDLNLEFRPADKKNLAMNVVIAKTDYDKNSKKLAWNEINDRLTQVSKSYLQGAEILEEKVSNPLDIDAGRYEYTCTYNIDDQTGAYTGWCIEDNSGNVFVEGVDCRVGKKDLESAVRLRDQFDEINAKDVAIKIPGFSDPKDLKAEGKLMVSQGNVCIHVPDNMFTEVENFTNEQGTWQKWVDDNGAIILGGMLVYSSMDEYKKITQEQMPALYALYAQVADEYLEGKVDYTDRVNVSAENNILTHLDSLFKYTLKIGGRDYKETDYLIMVSDDEQVYWFVMYMLAPTNRDTLYHDIFKNCYEGLTIEEQ